MRFIDKFLNAITMYRLVLSSLLIMAVIAIIFGFTGILSFGGLQLLASAVLLIVACYLTNLLLAKIFKAPRNIESALITGLILFFLMAPVMQWSDALMLILAGVLAMLSKYLFAFRRKHLFNPAAAGSFLLILAGYGLSIWWIGSLVMLPFVAISGLMIVRKIRRFSLFTAFTLSGLLTIIAFGMINHVAPLDSLLQAFTSWPLLFFGTYMLTEPLTTPPTKKLQILYGIITGLLFGSQFHLGPITSTPELALILGNLFSYLVSPKLKLKLFLKEKKAIAADIYEFIFNADRPFTFQPGQYLEWTLPHAHADSRGNRRYFTIASSPTEKEIHLGVRIQPQDSSSFKKALLALEKGQTMIASQLSGDFTLPTDPRQKFAFIAGGIGVTPFRSMIQYLIDQKKADPIKPSRDAVLFYACAKADGFAYRDLFTKAQQEIGLKTFLVLSHPPANSSDWSGKIGHITPEMIKTEVPDYGERRWYLSGPNAMVNAYKALLRSLGVSHSKIVTDYFPGF